jgi:predicted transposase/invertase (TIGR01784 family)
MQVANPIYDVVFKYLLDDNKIAKLLLSALIGVQIKKLQLRPQEYSSDLASRTLTVYRVDFKAEIVLSTGESKIVLIEIQKAKYTTDIMRFRKYLGEQYADKNNAIEDNKQLIPIPIISIYFLGYGLDHNPDIPIIRVNRQYLDNHTNGILKKKEQFIESLTHDSIIVQIPALKKKRRDDLEKALSVFEQSKIQTVSINEDDYPPKYKPIINILLKAISEPEIRKTMEIEDEILEDLERKERLISRQEKAIEEKEKAIEMERKEKLEAQLKLARKMKKYGETISEIIKETGLSEDEINKL